MLAFGSLLVGAGILLTGLLALLFRHPRAARWTGPELVAMLAVVPVTGLLGFGFGYMLLGGYRVSVRRRLRAYGAETSAVAPTLTVAGPAGSQLPGRSSPTPGTA